MTNQCSVLQLLLRTHHKIPNQSLPLCTFSSIPNTYHSKFHTNPNFNHFSSEPVLANTVDIFSKLKYLSAINKDLDSNHVSISHDAVNGRKFEKCGMDGEAVKSRELFDKDRFERIYSRKKFQIPHPLSISLRTLSPKAEFSSGFSGQFKHDERKYTKMAMILQSEYLIDQFWKLVYDMRSAGFKIGENTYLSFHESFILKKMLKDAVKLYEFVMAGPNKNLGCRNLLSSIVSFDELDMDLFSRAVKVFTKNGNALNDDNVEEVQKSLFSAGRIDEFNKVLKVMEHENDGFVATGLLLGTIAFRLRAAGYNEQADEFANRIEESRLSTPYLRMQDYILSYHNFEKGFESLKEIVEKEGVVSAANALDLIC
ncbi:hypothetical protein MtrunA17_Chr7g0220761 [Medicago truncatula]|uniref:PPR containing plant-like protein n=1 Tax=Medicago truncatula TaxID=3880 RepID=A0A396GTX4_MEDTR|nr:hypothetical protein MtrunA17_Chr7g0220761 [Medicago truncatula]